MQAPNTAYLTSVEYLPEGRAVAAEFSGMGGKQTMKYPFFPSFCLRIERKNRKLLEEMLSLYGARKFRLEYLPHGTARLTAATFLDLKKIANLLSASLMLNPFILEPERQFLLQRGWGYFQGFGTAGGEPEGKPLFGLPDADFGFLPETLPEALSDIASRDPPSAKKLIEKIILSGILCIPASRIPDSAEEQAEIFLENAFFRNSFAPEMAAERAYAREQRNHAHSAGSRKFAQLDFSGVCLALLTFPFFNLGPDTLNCRCCRPDSVHSANLSPHSLVNVRFIVDGVFFESKFARWAANFHISSPGMDKRLRWKQEWCLESIPAGPFYSGETARIPLADFAPLLERGYLSVLDSGHEFSWFCRRKESLLSREIAALNSMQPLIEKSAEEKEMEYLRRHGILSTAELSKNPDYLFLDGFRSVLPRLSNSIPAQLLSPKSKFYSTPLADAVSCIQAETIGRFRAFSAEMGMVSLQMEKSKVLVEGNSPLLVTKQFCSRFSLPSPNLCFA